MKKTLLLFFLLLTSSVFAQSGYEHLAVNAHGMGRTYVVSAKGIDALGLNPARLYDQFGKRYEIRLFPLASYGLEAGPSFRDASALGDVFGQYTEGNISDPDRKELTELLKDGKLSGRGDASVIGAAYASEKFGTFAFTWSTHAGLRTDIPDDFINFMSVAESAVTQYSGSYSGLDIQALWYNDYALSYSNQLYVNANDSASFLQFINAGASIKYIAGVGSYKLLSDNSFSHSTPSGGSTITVNYTVLSSYSDDFDPQNVPNRLSFSFLTPSTAGSGIGFDIGGYAGFIPTKLKRPALLIGTSITDIGSISWTNKAQVRAVYNDSRFFAFQGTTKDLNDSLKVFSGNLHDTASFTTALPTVFRFGSTFDIGAMGKRWFGFYPTLAFEYSVGLSETVGSFKNNRIGFGLGMNRQFGGHEVRFGTGIAFQKDLTDITLGVGGTIANIISIDLATGHFLDLFASGSILDVAFSVKAAF